MIKFAQKKERFLMLKVVVFDSGYGGELFADYLQENLPILQVVRVIDWRHSNIINTKYKEARKNTETALLPYINKVDLIIFANCLLSVTSLKYFKRKYPHQKFVGMEFPKLKTSSEREALVLTTKAITKTINYYNYLFRLKRRTKTIILDAWPDMIDNGELERCEILNTVKNFAAREKIIPNDIILTCTHFSEIKPELRSCFSGRVKIHDGFRDTLHKTCNALRLRGGAGKK